MEKRPRRYAVDANFMRFHHFKMVNILNFP